MNAQMPAGPARLASLGYPFYRRLAFPLAQRLLRPTSRAVLRALRASEHTSPAALRTRQDERLRALVQWSYETVPAYRRRFDESGVRPVDIGGATDLARLPILTKRDLKTGGAAFQSTRVDVARHWVQVTSGSTGEPLRAVRDLALRPIGQGTWWHALERCGIHPADSVMDIAGHKRPWVRPWHHAWNALRGVRPVTAEMLAGRDAHTINRFVGGWRPRLISGQPHRLARLGHMILDGEVRLGGPPRAVSYYGEILTDGARDVITRAFDAPIHGRYGAIEFVPLIAYTCEQGDYHVNAHHLIVEIVDGDLGAPDGAPARSGRIVVTDLTNFAAPYLRYEVGDLVTWGPDTVCACGRTWPRLASIHGRQTEAARTPSGREIGQSTLAHQMFRAVPELPDVVWEYQFRQREDELELRVVPRDGYRDEHGRRLQAALATLLHGEIDVRVARADALERGAGEKRPMLINDTGRLGAGAGCVRMTAKDAP